MAPDFHSPISRAIRPEDTADTLSGYRRSQQRGKDDYARMVKGFYDLITDFYEYGWGQSFTSPRGRKVRLLRNPSPAIRTFWANPSA